MDCITLADDPWSLEFRAALRASAHYATLDLWAAGQDPASLATPYYERLVTVKRATPEKAASMQAGFYSLLQAAPTWPAPEPVRFDDVWQGPIMFRIHGDGHLVSEDGWHRKVILEHLDLPISGRVIDRHSTWRNLQGRLRARMTGSGWKGKLYQPIPHPDFSEWPVHHQPPASLAGFARRHGVRSVLDLGANFGTVLTTLQPEIGVGVERDPVTFQVTRLVLEKHGLTAVQADVLEYLRENHERYDLVLALAILHHVPQHAEVLDLVRERARFVAVTVPTPSEAGSARLPPEGLRYVRERLGARIVAATTYANRPLHVLEVRP